MPADVKTPPPVSETPTADTGLSFAERAYRVIRDRLVMLDIAPGSPLDDDELASSLGMGRTPVREALKRLEYERLVVAYPRRGTFATEVNITDLAHISEVRQQLEPPAAESAAVRSGDGDRARLVELLAQLDSDDPFASGTGSLMRLDMAIHRAMYAATHNPYLEDTLVRYDNLATRIWCLFLERLPDMADHVTEHRSLIHAVLDRDGEAAARLTRQHIWHFDAAIRAAI